MPTLGLWSTSEPSPAVESGPHSRRPSLPLPRPYRYLHLGPRPPPWSTNRLLNPKSPTGTPNSGVVDPSLPRNPPFLHPHVDRPQPPPKTLRVGGPGRYPPLHPRLSGQRLGPPGGRLRVRLRPYLDGPLRVGSVGHTQSPRPVRRRSAQVLDLGDLGRGPEVLFRTSMTTRRSHSPPSPSSPADLLLDEVREGRTPLPYRQSR